jgi:hypothetical protein
MKWYLIVLISTSEVFTDPSHTNLIFISVFSSLREAGALLAPLLVTRLDLYFATFINPSQLSHHLYGVIYQSRLWRLGESDAHLFQRWSSFLDLVPPS